MIEVIERSQQHHKDRGWLNAYWHFSFGDYYDPNNTRFGPLRVFNNDRITPGQGFPEHRHEDMEIITWILSGRLEHRDSTDENPITVGRHEVQRMSAGTGIQHSEYNASDTKTLHLFQIWIEPEEQRLDPEYEDAAFTDEDLRGELVPVVSGRESAPVGLNQDATMRVGLLEPGSSVSVLLSRERRGYLVVGEGRLTLNDHVLEQGDAARIEEEERLELEPRETTEVVFLDLP